MGQSQVIFQKVCREKQKRYIWSIKSLQTLPFFLLWRSAKPVSPAPSSGLSLSKIENWTFFCQKIPFQNRKHCTWGNFFCWLRVIYELIICFEIFHHELKWIWSNLYSARLVVSPKQKLSCITNCSYSHLFRKPTIFKRFWQFSQGGDPQRMSFYADLIWCRLCQSTASNPMKRQNIQDIKRPSPARKHCQRKMPTSTFRKSFQASFLACWSSAPGCLSMAKIVSWPLVDLLPI